MGTGMLEALIAVLKPDVDERPLKEIYSLMRSCWGCMKAMRPS